MKTLRFISTLTCLFGTLCRLYAHPFTNGSFESYGGTAASTILLSDGDTSVTNWTVGLPNGSLISLLEGRTYAAYGIDPIDGSRQIVFNNSDTTPGGTICQDFDTQSGRTYTVSFYVARHGPAGGELSLKAEALNSDGAIHPLQLCSACSG